MSVTTEGRLIARFGENLRRIRLARGLTQAEVASALGRGTGSGYVSAVEAGRIAVTLRTLAALARILEVDPAALLK